MRDRCVRYSFPIWHVGADEQGFSAALGEPLPQLEGDAIDLSRGHREKASPYYGSAPIGSAPASRDPRIDGLLWGAIWGHGEESDVATVEHSFPTYGATWQPDYGLGEPTTALG